MDIYAVSATIRQINVLATECQPLLSAISGDADFEVVPEADTKPVHPRPLNKLARFAAERTTHPSIAAYRRKPCESRPASKK